MGKFLLASIFTCYLMGCSKLQSNSATKNSETLKQDFSLNKSKWEEQKNTIDKYKIVESSASPFGYGEKTIVVDAKNNFLISCVYLYQHTFGGNNVPPVIKDCSSDPYSEKNAEDYFDYLFGLISQNNLEEYTFHPLYGIPLDVAGSPPNQDECADCMAAGFHLTFEVIE